MSDFSNFIEERKKKIESMYSHVTHNNDKCPWDLNHLKSWFPTHRIQNGDFIILSPFRPDTRLGSFRISIRDRNFGVWIDHSTGEKGSLYSIVKHMNLDPDVTKDFDNPRKSGKTLESKFRKRKQMNECRYNVADLISRPTIRQMLYCKPAQLYFQNRGILLQNQFICDYVLKSPKNLLFASVAKVEDKGIYMFGSVISHYETGCYMSLQLIDLDVNGNRVKENGHLPSKKFLPGNPVGKGITCLGNVNADICIVTEGLETGLALLQEIDQPAYLIVCYTCNGYSNADLLASRFERIIISQDNDQAGVNASTQLKDRLIRLYCVSEKKIEVYAPPGDLNDWADYALVKNVKQEVIAEEFKDDDLGDLPF